VNGRDGNSLTGLRTAPRPARSSAVGRAAPLLVAALCILGWPAGVRAECRGPEQAADFVRSLRSAVVCSARSLEGAGGECTTPPAACGAAAVAATVALLRSADSSDDLSPQRIRCIREMHRAAFEFVDRRIRERLAGQRPQGRSRHALARLAGCDRWIGQTGGAGGSDCLSRASALGSTGELRECLRPRLEAAVGQAVGRLRPNVVLVVTDDHHPEVTEYMPRTLAAVAGRGIRFANAFTTSPLCSPSRASLLTGQRPARHGVVTNGVPGPDGVRRPGLEDTPTLATWFQTAGYRTALIGKYLNFYVNMSPAIPPGWDEWRVFVGDVLLYFNYELNENGTIRQYGNADEDYSTDVLSRLSEQFVAANADREFFLLLAPFAPHSPAFPAPRHRELVDSLEPWRPKSWGEERLEDKPGWLRMLAQEPDELVKQDLLIARQRAAIGAVDEAIDGLVRRLEEIGVADNTILVVSADHGLQWGEHRWVGKLVPYEESIRIPMMVRYPLRVDAGQVRNELVTNLDVAPTLASWTGVPMGGVFDGRSWDELLEGTGGPWRAEVVIENPARRPVMPWAVLRGARFKLIRYASGAEELYDLEADRAEMNNLAKLPQSELLRRQMRQRLSRRSQLVQPADL